MADASFTNFFNRPFGLNVRVNDKTLKQASETLSISAGSVLSPVFDYLESNEKVFNGEVATEINKVFAQSFNIGARMQQEDKKVNGPKPKFDNKF